MQDLTESLLELVRLMADGELIVTAGVTRIVDGQASGDLQSVPRYVPNLDGAPMNGPEPRVCRGLEHVHVVPAAVVRHGDTKRIAVDGQEYDKSLTRGCMACHTSRENFCARCHDYADVRPACWDCHVEPDEN